MSNKAVLMKVVVLGAGIVGVSSAGLLAIEPAFKSFAHRIVGGTYAASDESGEAPRMNFDFCGAPALGRRPGLSLA